MRGWLIIGLSGMATLLLFFAAKTVSPAANPLLAGSQLLALLGVMSLAWTFVLAVRHQTIELLFGGLDRAYKAHHLLGAMAFVFVVNHVLLLIVSALPVNTVARYLLPGSNLAYNLGILALDVMLVLILMTLYVRLPYRYWKWSHEWMGLVMVMGGLHAVMVESDTASYLPLRLWVVGWSLLATAAFGYKRFIYYFLGVSEYEVGRRGRVRDMMVLSLLPRGKVIDFEPGQYGFFSLVKHKREEHAFSILGADDQKLIIGVKIVGKFTEELSKLPLGEIVLVRGPFGTFGQKMKRTNHAVWIAGGIGVTPFLTMARALRHEQRVEMYYCARILPPRVITGSFENLARQNPRFKWLIRETSKAARVTGREIFESTGCDRQADYLLCGPKTMMESLAEQLAQLGIRRSHIIYEDFAFK